MGRNGSTSKKKSQVGTPIIRSTQNSTEIYVVAKQGDPDPHSNQKLKFVIDQRTYNVPISKVIDRAIEKPKVAATKASKSRHEGFDQMVP